MYKKSKILVVGYGKSGQSAAALAKKNGADVWVYDDTPISKMDNFPFVSKFEVRSSNFDLLVTSPGIPFNHPVLKFAAEQNWPVISELEFAYNILKPQFVIGVTGTNGKTTVVELIDYIFKLSGKPYTVAGNIGTPLSAIESINGPLILELSSFQLHFIDRFRVNIGVILNVTEDHLDWHCCFGQYLQDKLKLFSNQESQDIALLNIDNEALSSQLSALPATPRLRRASSSQRILTFGVQSKADYGVKDGYLTAREEKIIPINELLLKGDHNISNVLAAMAVALEAGIDVETIKKGLKTFKGLKHRLQFVAQKNDISFYNDSKSTNPDSTKKAVEAFSKPIILIMGGRNKGNNFSFISTYLNSQIKELIIYGEAAEEIKEHIGHGHVVKTLDQAVQASVKKSEGQDIVVFSPGCSSFDLFANYAQRGDAFIKAVEEL